MRKLNRKALWSLFDAISQQYKLYIPQDTDGGTAFLPYTEGAAFSEKQTVRSPKDFFFPQTETLVSFRVAGKNLSIEDIPLQNEPFVLFGVRACDLHSFEVLDRVFLSEPVDTFYKSRRENATVVTLACRKPSETCFCETFGADPAAPGGDAVCYMTDGEVFLEAITEKGRTLMEATSVLTEECPPDTVDAEKENIRKKAAALPLRALSAEGFGAGKTALYFDSPAWKKLSQACLGCGTCTYVCPTCQCYDIRDVKRGEEVRRCRTWDSCMYSEFTKMSAGQPRATQTERFRQRFMHKLVYFPENNDGLYGCVGCGRCLRSCPVQMNIVKVMKELRKGGKENG